jgi:hypothetical protein
MDSIACCIPFLLVVSCAVGKDSAPSAENQAHPRNGTGRTPLNGYETNRLLFPHQAGGPRLEAIQPHEHSQRGFS